MQASAVREGIQDIRHQIEDASLEQERAKAAGGDWLSRVEEGLAAERAVPPAAGWRALMEKAGGDMTDRELLMLSDDTFAALLGHYGFGAGPDADAILEYRARNKVDEAVSPAAAATGGDDDAAREGEVRTPSASPAVAVSHASGSPAQPHYESYRAYEAALAPLPLAPPAAGAVAVAADTAAELGEAGSPPPPPYTPHAREAASRGGAATEVGTPPVGGAKREGWLAAYLASVGATNAFSQLDHLGLGAAAAPAEEGTPRGDDAPRGGYTPSRRLYNAEELAERGRSAKQRAESRIRTKQDKHAAAAAAAAAAADEEAAAAAAAKRPEWDSRPALRKTGEAELEKLRMKLDARPPAEQRKRPVNAAASKSTQAAAATAAARSRSRAAAASRRSQTTVAARPALSQRSRSSRLPRQNHHHHHHHSSAGAVNLFPGCTNVCCSRFNNQRPTSAPRARAPDARRSVESVAAAASAASAAAAAAAAAASAAAYPLGSYASSVPRTYTPEAYASALNAAALAGVAVPAAPVHYAPPPPLPLPAVPASDEAPILSPARLDAAAASAAAAAAAAAAIPQAESPAAVAAAAAAAAYSPLRCARSLEPLFLPDTAYLPVLPDISAPPPLAMYVPLTVPVGPASPSGEVAAAAAVEAQAQAQAEAEAATDEEPASSPYMPTDTPAEPAPHAPAPVASPDLRAAAPAVHSEDELPSPRRLDQQRSLTYDPQEVVRGASGTSEELPAPPVRKVYKELCSPPVPSAAEAEAAAAAAAAAAATAAEEVVAEHSRELAAGLPAGFYERALVSPCIPAELSYGADSPQKF